MGFDIAVIGGGHAGCEAAAVAARMGARVALVTQNMGDIGRLSCNPAIGGIGKGHLVREIDVLDGIMGRAADLAGTHFRVLNRRKGPAVQGPRVQVDRRLYASAVRALIDDQGVTVLEARVANLILNDRRVLGVMLEDGSTIQVTAVVLATGTFLNATQHMGEQVTGAGRAGQPASVALARQIERLGIRTGRFKTGTPPRIDGRTIDWAGLDMQPGDTSPMFLSGSTVMTSAPQIACALTSTTPATHAIIRAGLVRSPVFNGTITAKGPRYCPSIEDKVTRFAERNGHHVFLEPEGLDDVAVYPNGISTSLPADTQRDLVRTMPGLQVAELLRPGYAIEYTYADPRQLESSLAVRNWPGLFLAGQINGTTGYEEAAAQGLVAGLNAARFAAGKDPVPIDRSTSYLGVLVDDLTTRGVDEPYRMLTSRSEQRLTLRIDNAGERLGAQAIAWGCVGADRARQLACAADALERARTRIGGLTTTPSRLAALGIGVPLDGVKRTALEWMRFPRVGWSEMVRIWPELADIDAHTADTVSTEAHYAHYLQRQSAELSDTARNDGLRISGTLDYNGVVGLSNEARAALEQARPVTLGSASRLRGMTPGAVMPLLAHVRRQA